jgi:hypothetical protein
MKVKRPLRRPSSRWVYNIKANFKEAEQEGVDWVQLTQRRG